MQTIKYYYLILFWIIFIPPDNFVAQESGSGNMVATEETVVQNQLWVDYLAHLYISEKLEYYGDTGYRTNLDDYSWNKVYVRPSVRYHFSDMFEGHGGVGLFYVFNKDDANQFEVRPWQGVKFNWPRFEKLKFYNYLRLEERISFLTDDWKASFDFRLRYKLGGKWILFKTGPDSYWLIPFFAEVFYPVFDNIEEFFENESRGGIGLGYNPSKEWQFSVNFYLQKSSSGPDESLDISDNIFRLEVKRLWNYKTLIKF